MKIPLTDDNNAPSPLINTRITCTQTHMCEYLGLVCDLPCNEVVTVAIVPTCRRLAARMWCRLHPTFATLG
jgi:hypothetical protein